MLVLSRHVNESIIIGDSIVVTVVDIRADKVRLGISAPNDVVVHRLEIYEDIQRADGVCRLTPEAMEHLARIARNGGRSGGAR